MLSIPKVYLLQLCQKIKVKVSGVQSSSLSPLSVTNYQQLDSTNNLDNKETGILHVNIESYEKTEMFAASDAASSSVSERNHILLKRPNTIVLHATVADGLAARGYTLVP